MTRPSRILILKPCCLGDVLMATPLAAALKTAWPAATIDWAVDSHSRPALIGNPHVSRLIDATGVIRGQFHKHAYVRLWNEVRGAKYDAAFVPDRAPLLALLPWLAGIPLRVGLDSGGRGWCHTVRVRGELDVVKLEGELYLDLARAVGVPAGPARPVFVPSKGDEGKAEQLLAELMAADQVRRRILAVHPAGGVNPGMTLMEKRWPAESYAELCRLMLAEGLADQVVVLGGPDDGQVCADVARGAGDMAGHVHNVAGRLSLGATAALIARCLAFVGNDTGVAHLAMAVGTPAVVVFGPTDPRRYGPPPGLGVAVGPPPEEQNRASVRGRRGGVGLAPEVASGPEVAGNSASAPESVAVHNLRQAGGSPAILAVTVAAVTDAVRGVLGQ